MGETFPRDGFSLIFFTVIKSGNELFVSKITKEIGATDFFSEIKRVENYSVVEN